MTGVAGLAASAVGLWLSGRGGLAAPPFGDPGRWPAWLAARDPALAAFALLRVAALVALWYLLVVTVVGLVLRLVGTLRLIAIADRVTIAPVRRMLAGGLSLGLAASGLTVVGPTTRLPVAAAAQSAPPTTTAAAPGTVTMHQLSPAGQGVTTDPESPAPAATIRPDDHWTVAPGQCFWSIAESVLATHLGRAPGDAEIVPYWRRLIDANRNELVARNNPDLVFPGQVFQVPAP